MRELLATGGGWIIAQLRVWITHFRLGLAEVSEFLLACVISVQYLILVLSALHVCSSAYSSTDCDVC